MSFRQIIVFFAAGFFSFFSIAFLIPVSGVFIRATGVNFSDIPPDFFRVIRFTYFQAALSSVLAGVVGIPLAFLLQDRSEKWARALWYASLLPFSVPGLLYALSFIGTWHSYGFIPILVAHVFLNFPVYVRWVGLALQRDGEKLERAALALGASRSQCLIHITWPKIRAACTASFLLCFLYCAASFIVVLTLGGNPRFTTLEVALYESIRMIFDLNRATLYAVTQLLIFIVLFVVSTRFHFISAMGRPVIMRLPSVYRPRTLVFATLSTAVMGLFVVGLFAPIGHLVVSAIPAFLKLDVATWIGAWATSLALGLGAALFAVVLSFCSAYVIERTGSSSLRAVIEFLSTLPLAVSTLILGLGILLIYPVGDLGVFSFLPICILQSIGILPLAVQAFRLSLRQVPPNVLMAASSLGASPTKVLLRIDLPLQRAALALVVALSMSFSLSEMGSLLLFYSSGIETLSLATFRHMGRYDFDGAYALGALLLATVFFVNLAAGWLEERIA